MRTAPRTRTLAGPSTSLIAWSATVAESAATKNTWSALPRMGSIAPAPSSTSSRTAGGTSVNVSAKSTISRADDPRTAKNVAFRPRMSSKGCASAKEERTARCTAFCPTPGSLTGRIGREYSPLGAQKALTLLRREGATGLSEPLPGQADELVEPTADVTEPGAHRPVSSHRDDPVIVGEPGPQRPIRVSDERDRGL